MQKQARANAFIEPALGAYFTSEGSTRFRGEDMTNAVESEGLRKSYGEKAVLKGIDPVCAPGDIFACWA